MDKKHWQTLELNKILARLAKYAQFSGSQELARNLEPISEIHEARDRLTVTGEARRLLEMRPDTGIGGARDVRPKVTIAQRGATLLPTDLLDIHATLTSGRGMQRVLTRLQDQFPLLADVAARIQAVQPLIDDIERCIDDQGEVRDNASSALARARREVRVAYDRLQDRLQRVLSSASVTPYLQEAIITQRGGRYVIPIKSDFKGRVKGVVHDQSGSGQTLFIEPLATVEPNNKWREAQLAEEKEVQKILISLSARVAENADAIQWTVDALAEIDLAFAKARYADAIEASEPELVSFPPTSKTSTPKLHPGCVLRLKRACHPLLDPASVVPIDVELDDNTFIVVITGPNTGGKTVSLKTIGLLTLMAQCGLHIPAAPGSAISCFEQVFADIGDEQSIEQNLSTFSSHLTNILSFLKEAGERSLVLFDELGAGTDPAEGSAIARSIIDYMRDKGATTFVATHYPELKIYAHTTTGVANANVEFDLDTLSPTFRLTIGLPGRSNAFAIAARLGLPSHIIKAARGMVDESDLQTEDLLAGIAEAHKQTLLARQEAEVARQEAQDLQTDVRAQWTYIEDARREVVNAAREQAHQELQAVQAEISGVRARLQAASALEAVEQTQKDVETLQPLVKPEPEPLPPPPEKFKRVKDHPIAVGDTVWVQALGTSGQVVNLFDDGGEAEVQAGRMRVRVKVKELFWQEALPEPTTEDEPLELRLAQMSQSPGIELDLRGQIIEDALPQVDRHLDAAALAGLPWVHIIHGHGTGALKRAVRDMFGKHPLVKSFAPAPQNQGGEGVTVARLV